MSDEMIFGKTEGSPAHNSIYKRWQQAITRRTLKENRNKIRMKLLMKTISLLLLAVCIVISCRDENENSINDNSKLLIGDWNSYENGTEQTGFTPGITTSLTMFYESGIAFSSDGTFKARYHNNGTWTESNIAIGTYELKDKTIALIYSGTNEEHKLDLQLVKLDEKHLWFKHSLFVEIEYHLERATN